MGSKETTSPSKKLTRNTTSSKEEVTISASNAVLKTPELLEMILIHLDMREIFSLQRVCHHWHEIIAQDSLILRRKLYLAPALRESLDYPTDNLFLKSHFPKLSTYLLQGAVKWRPKWVKALDESDLEALEPGLLECESASWRKMLLTQPPIKEMNVYVAPTIVEGEKGVPRGVSDLMDAQVLIKNDNGITIGMIIEAGEKARRRSIGVKRNDSGYASVDVQIVAEGEPVDTSSNPMVS
ncbi:hypothetical protein EJ08DRAFT_321320 [Tothia fuscella]|uniref:F-box domain-containing protein n=1 Tax=Tothia fuscella TaxID=1048955 RepID=A0A9P4NN68_9PEZI|nr:hypothetical protein EJ08DRAFT_321320 [Tothia fuscella]